MEWIDVNLHSPTPLSDPKERNKDNALLLYTPVDGRVYVGWYLGENAHDWRYRYILATSKSYQALLSKVSHWMPVPEAPK